MTERAEGVARIIWGATAAPDNNTHFCTWRFPIVDYGTLITGEGVCEAKGDDVQVRARVSFEVHSIVRPE